MFDTHNHQRRISIFQQSVYVAIDLPIKMAKMVFMVIAIVHRLCAQRSL